MKANIYLEERFIKDKNNNYASVNNSGDQFWDRYLNVFDQINIIARVKEVKTIPKNALIIKNKRIHFTEIPYYHGAKNFLLKSPKIIFYIYKATKNNGINILRLPGTIGSIASIFIRIKKTPYGIELVADPYEVFSKGGVGGLFSLPLQKLFTYNVKKLCLNAKGVSYVTKNTMQKRYPTGKGKMSTHYSSIHLPDNLIIKTHRIPSYIESKKFHIFMAGTMDQMYKGFDTAIDALALIKSKENMRKINISIAGDGIYKDFLINYAKEKNVYENISFLGKITREEVINNLDNADLFLMPSRTEGLPRALIEAMARGVPAFGSNIGGIPELLSHKYLFNPEDSKKLAELIEDIIDKPDELSNMSKNNIKIANEYRLDILFDRQNKFYTYLANY